MSKTIRTLASLAALAALSLVVAAPAAAKDRNNDRIPDRWEKRHGLSLKVNQAKRDQDKDGLRNRVEFRLRTDPRAVDSDGDGIDDPEEGGGRIAAYDPESGELTINVFGAGSITGLVTPETEIRCRKGHHGGRCGTEALVVGEVVREAELEFTEAGLWFEEIRMVRREEDILDEEDDDLDDDDDSLTDSDTSDDADTSGDADTTDDDTTDE